MGRAACGREGPFKPGGRGGLDLEAIAPMLIGRSRWHGPVACGHIVRRPRLTRSSRHAMNGRRMSRPFALGKTSADLGRHCRPLDKAGDLFVGSSDPRQHPCLHQPSDGTTDRVRFSPDSARSDRRPQVSQAPNVARVISGLGMVDCAISAFGVDRCMFASSFPGDKRCQATTRSSMLQGKLPADFPAMNATALFHDNAVNSIGCDLARARRSSKGKEAPRSPRANNRC